MILPPSRYRLLKNFAYLPLCLAITACGGGGGSSSDNDTGGEQPASNIAPKAVNDTATTSNRVSEISIDVLANDSDSDGDALSISSVGVSTEGITPVIENGLIRYSLPDGFHGIDEFTYTISDGESEASATVKVTINSTITISGIIGETVTGSGDVSIIVGNKSYSANLDNGRFSADILNAAEDDIVSVTATFSQTDIGKAVVLKSYVGLVSQLENASKDGIVSESDLAGLYVSAASTSAAAIIERSAGHEISSAEELIRASQVLPQELILDGAVAVKSVLAGDVWDTFNQQDTYALLKAYPTAIGIAESLKEGKPSKFDQYRTAVLGDSKQAVSLTGYSDAELLFLLTSSSSNRPSGFVLQLSGGTSGEGHLAIGDFFKTDENKVTFTLTGLETTINTDGVLPSTQFSDGREICAPDINGQYFATPVERTFRKYLDTAAFSAYVFQDTYRCDATSETFESEASYAQVNMFSSGDFRALTQSTFALGTYLAKDPEIYDDSYWWQPVMVTPNTNGTITQRFDFNSGYTDEGSVSHLENGRMAINMNRGDYIEYVPLGMDGPALKTLGILKRADGSAVSVGGDYLVPITDGLTLPTPAKIVYADSAFSITDVESDYFDRGFGFEFLADNTGYQLWRPVDVYEATATSFNWSQAEGYIDMGYNYHRTEYNFPTTCEPADPDCVEYRFRELEPLAEHNGDYFIRVYQEYDFSAMDGLEPGTDVFISGYIDRFSVNP